MIGTLIGPGALIAIGGPSGVGKDTLIAHARARFAADPRIHFVRRIVTRPAEAGGEDHLAVSPEEFGRMAAAGAFAVSWHAHGLGYGLPASLDSAIGAGRVVVANVSRTMLPLLRRRYARVVPVCVTAGPDTLRRRLAARGREDAGEIARRVARTVAAEADGAWIELRNDGPVAVAGDALCAIIAGVAG